jgi:condensin-2 complex subunit G2
MLLRLYEPIIWRSLKVANPLGKQTTAHYVQGHLVSLTCTTYVFLDAVRRNATVLLADAFPLQDPDSAQRETDELLQKQFNQFEALLNDDVPVVRCVAVQVLSVHLHSLFLGFQVCLSRVTTHLQGVCRILGVFWELIPPATIRTLLTRLINDSARDKAYGLPRPQVLALRGLLKTDVFVLFLFSCITLRSSSAVRQAVFEGLRYLLDNHLSQPVLKSTALFICLILFSANIAHLCATVQLTCRSWRH